MATNWPVYHGSDRAQSEVVSSILMVGVITVAVTTMGVAVLATQDDGSDDGPRANVDAIVTTDSVEFAHQGGRTLETADLSVKLQVNGSDEPLSLSSGTWSGPDDSRFEGGERWWIQRPTHRKATVEVWLIDEDSNRVLVTETRNPTPNASEGASPNPQVSLTTPSGGATYMAGQTVTIDWTESDDETSIASRTVEYSTDGGSTWTTIAEDDGVTTEEDWTVPSVDTGQGYVRVTVTDSDADGPYSASARNGAAFTIDAGAPSVSVDQPNGGEVLGGGGSYTAQWTASDDETSVDGIDVDYSVDGGGSWSSLATGLSNDGSESIAVPYETTTNALVRVTASDTEGNTTSDESDGTFTIDSTNPSITADAPNGGETFRGGETATIQWTASDSAAGLDSFDVDYSTDGGSTWTDETVVSTGAVRAHAWTVPNVDSSNVLVRVEATDAAGNTATDESDGTFTVDSTAPSVTVSDPNGGESVSAGSTYTITWSDSDALSGVDSADVDYSTDGGSTWSDVATVTDGSESVDWSVPDVETSNALVRVTATDGAGNAEADQSDSTFTISSSGGSGGQESGNGLKPRITQFDITDASSGKNAEYDISWSVSDPDGDLASVTVDMVHLKNTKEVATDTSTVSGSSASGTAILNDKNGLQQSNEYRLTLTVSDSGGNVRSVSWTDTASGSGSAQRDPGRAYKDSNGDGLYESGSDQTLTTSDLESNDIDYTSSGASLVIPESVGTINIMNTNRSYAAASIYLGTTIQSNMRVALTASTDDIIAPGTIDTYDGGAGNGDVKLTASQGAIEADGGTFKSKQQIRFQSAMTLNANGTTIDADPGGAGNGDILLRATSGDGAKVTAKGASIKGKNLIELNGEGVILDQASVDNYAGGAGNGEMKLLGTGGESGNVSLVGATLNSKNTVVTKAASRVDGGTVDVARLSVLKGSSDQTLSVEQGDAINEGQLTRGTVVDGD